MSIWEVAIKRSLDRPDFRTDSRVLRHALLANGYEEMAVTGARYRRSNVAVDPQGRFDRLILAQAPVEGITLATADPPMLARYPGSVTRV